MGEGNGNRQAGQNQSLPKAGNERNGKKVKEIEEILSAYDFMKKEGLLEIEYVSDNAKFKIKRKSVCIPASTFFIKEKKKEEEKKEEVIRDAISIKTPLSGTFYASPKHGAPPYVNVGDTIEEGKTVCIVEAMKVMNEIKTDAKYKILKVLAVNAKSVSTGEVLFLVKPV